MEEAHHRAAEAEVLRWVEAAAAVVLDNPWWKVVGVVEMECVGGGKAKVAGVFGREFQVTVLVVDCDVGSGPNFRAAKREWRARGKRGGRHPRLYANARVGLLHNLPTFVSLYPIKV